jgi:hypothetical protein
LQKVLYDIRQEKDAKQIASKHEWMSDWREKAVDGDTGLFIEDEAAIYQSSVQSLRIHLILAGFTWCVELALFKRIFRSTQSRVSNAKTIRSM